MRSPKRLLVNPEALLVKIADSNSRATILLLALAILADSFNVARARLEDLQKALGWNKAELEHWIHHLDQAEAIAGGPGGFMLNPEVICTGPRRYINADIERFWQRREGTLLPMRRPKPSEETRILKFTAAIRCCLQGKPMVGGTPSRRGCSTSPYPPSLPFKLLVQLESSAAANPSLRDFDPTHDSPAWRSSTYMTPPNGFVNPLTAPDWREEGPRQR